MKRLVLALLLLVFATVAFAQRPGDLVVLYDNDVHCAVKGYPVMAGLRDSLVRMGCDVRVVSAGDFSFGGPIGAASKGVDIVRLMNAVGYDAACMGNHEFDYGLEQQRYLQSITKTAFLCCNMLTVKGGNSTYPPYHSCVWRGKSVAFIGVTTPSTMSSSMPSTFQNKRGRQLYHFSEHDLAKVIQQKVDQVRAKGADYVVLLAHLGDSPGATSSVSMIGQTRGIDLVVDGHDHHVLADKQCRNADGDLVPLTSTGTQFQYIGMAVLGADGHFSTRLLSVDSLAEAGCASKAVADTLDAIVQAFEAKGNSVVASCLATQVAVENDIRVCRLRETNLGDLVADAYRTMMQTDIAILNAGGLRANINSGAVSHNMLYAVSPFDNKIVAIRTSGKEILAALENAVSQYPKAEGCFVQVSGLSFHVDFGVPANQGRVSRVMVGDKPLDLKKKYTVAGPEYILLKGGDGFDFSDARLLATSVKNDLELLEEFITDHLKGVIAEPYLSPQGRIVVKGE